MSQFEGGQPSARTESDSGIYATLIGVAFLALAVAVGVVWYQNVQITGETNPFAMVDSANP